LMLGNTLFLVQTQFMLVIYIYKWGLIIMRMFHTCVVVFFVSMDAPT